MIGAVLSFLSWLFERIFRRNKTQARVEAINAGSRETANLGRQADEDNRHAQSKITAETAAAAAAVDADSLRDGAQRLNDAVDRADRDVRQ